MRKQITIEKITHRGELRIKVNLPNEAVFKEKIKSIAGRKWSQSLRSWHVPYTKDAYATLQRLFEHTEIIGQQSSPSEVSDTLTISTQPVYSTFERNGEWQKMVVGQQIICDCQEASWFILYIPFDKKGWIDAVRNIHGRKWNTEEKYWQLPYVKESFRALKQHIGMQHLVFNFEINPDIPDSLASPKNKLVRQPKFQLNEFQKKAVVAFEEKMMLENKAWRTRKTYKGLFKRFVAYFPNTKPSQITRKQIEEYIIYRKQDNISDSQLHQLINCFNCFYVRLLEQPEKVVKLERPKKKKKLPNVFSLEEIELLLKVNTNLKHQCMLILIYSGGLRKSELLDLRVEDISFDRKTIFIRNAKGGKDRCTFFSEVAQKYTAEYLKIYQPKHYLFEGQSGGRYSETSLQSIYEKAKKRAQVRKNVTLHGLRHSFATHLVEKGVPLHVVQELLGHSSIKTTEIYLHISNKFRKELRSPLDDLEL